MAPQVHSPTLPMSAWVLGHKAGDHLLPTLSRGLDYELHTPFHTLRRHPGASLCLSFPRGPTSLMGVTPNPGNSAEGCPHGTPHLDSEGARRGRAGCRGPVDEALLPWVSPQRVGVSRVSKAQVVSDSETTPRPGCSPLTLLFLYFAVSSKRFSARVRGGACAGVGWAGPGPCNPSPPGHATP